MMCSENDNKISTFPGQIVHQDCRRDYTRLSNDN